jgi:hypothetical protein
MSDDPSVLGNLPRSRPGRRSSKRDGAKAAPKPRATATKPAGAKPKPKRAASAKPRGRAGSAPARARSVAKEPPPTRQPARAADPVSGAIRLAGQVAGAGFKVAGEVLKRLPRP